jgi:hypothetical protein
MSKAQKSKRNASPAAPVVPGRQFPRLVVIVLAVVVVAAAGFWWKNGRQADAPSAVGPEAALNSTNQPDGTAVPKPGFEKLTGKWLRPDGGYILEIRNVEPGGKMDAGYFNPRPINVAKAEASYEGQTVKIFIELRDVNYPGSTYDLTFDPLSDSLKGIYYQAALHQRFEVAFERTK